jgi:hypothetical protein
VGPRAPAARPACLIPVPTPRDRSCNAAYALWICAQAGTGLLAAIITDILTAALAGPPPPPRAAAAAAASGAVSPRAAGASAAAAASSGGGPAAALVPGPHILLAINRNMLAMFLVANLMTGAINLSIDTLAVGDAAARLIVGEMPKFRRQGDAKGRRALVRPSRAAHAAPRRYSSAIPPAPLLACSS